MNGNQIDTKNVAEHRQLKFESVDDVLAEVDRILQADEQGQLKTAGNWTAGQIMSHIAAWIEYGYDGYPLKPPPFFIRWMLRLQLKKYLRRGMPKGAHIPGVKGGTYGADEMPSKEAAERLRQAFFRIQRGEPANFDNPGFGKMDHEQRVKLNLRHAELHLGFLNY